jgi:hypothetical protein
MNVSLLTGPGPVVPPATDSMMAYLAHPPVNRQGRPPVRRRHPADRAVVGDTMAGVQATPAEAGPVRERSTCG